LQPQFFDGLCDGQAGLNELNFQLIFYTVLQAILSYQLIVLAQEEEKKVIK
jgi:hypothetical protein